jgi:hypothetical protein
VHRRNNVGSLPEEMEEETIFYNFRNKYLYLIYLIVEIFINRYFIFNEFSLSTLFLMSFLYLHGLYTHF